MGPAVVDTSASCSLLADSRGRASIFDLGKLPPALVTDCAAPLPDGDLPLNVSIDIEPADLGSAKLQFDTSHQRIVEPTDARAHGDARAETPSGYERRKMLPMRTTATLVARWFRNCGTRARTKPLRQRVKDLGAELRLLRCE